MLSKTFATVSAISILSLFVMPPIASAATLTVGQVQSIVTLLQAFNVDAATVAQVESELGGQVASSTGDTTTPSVPVTPTNPTPTPTPTPPTPVHVPVIDSVYPSSAIGYDISFNTTYYPVDRFGFAVIGVNRGKAFNHNARLSSEFAWAHFGSTVHPTLYMNLNAPYGSTVAANIGAPKTCPVEDAANSSEPTVCQGYNYGYNAAKDAYTYSKQSAVSSPFWWLDVEEANSWSLDLAVNDATIQGAIDYLNTQNIHVGIYSMTYMWNAIAGPTFVPTQTLNGRAVTTPNWLPIGIETRVGAINSCVTRSGFIPGSPLWIVQYVLSGTSVDQNLSC